jgi:tetratricopeptide (TPR) repeat protein
VGGEQLDAPAGTFVVVDPGMHRAAVNGHDGATVVLVVGGPPGAALPVSAFEHYYAAQPAYDAGDYDRAIEIASEALREHPDHPLVHYQLACYHALAGRVDEARRCLDVAFAGDERTRAWAAEDEDLAALREQ